MRGRRALQDIGGQSRGDVCASMALLRGIECGNVAEPRDRAAPPRVALRGMRALKCAAQPLHESRTISNFNFRICGQLTNEL